MPLLEPFGKTVSLQYNSSNGNSQVSDNGWSGKPKQNMGLVRLALKNKLKPSNRTHQNGQKNIACAHEFEEGIYLNIDSTSLEHLTPMSENPNDMSVHVHGSIF